MLIKLKYPKFLPNQFIPRFIRSDGLLRTRAKLVNHLLKNYGWLRSFHEKRCVNAKGEFIPWFTYPAIDFLSQLDLSNYSVFEYGSGASTLFWSRKAKSVVSIESEEAWYNKVLENLPSNVELLLVSKSVEEYAGSINTYDKFDVIIIDGTGDSRQKCCELALDHMQAGGIIILDNSDLWLKSAQILRNSDLDLIQIDFIGFAPLSSSAHCTSIFFTRDYNFKPIGNYQPHKSVAQPAEPWPAESLP